MKKIAVLCLLGCILVLPAIAQLNVGGYVSSFFVPYRYTSQNDDAYHTTAVQTPWGEPDISAGLNFGGHSEFGGFHLGIDIANGAANRSAHATSAKGSGWVWVKPFDFIPYMETFTMWLGNPNNDRLAGKIGGSNLSTYVLNNSWHINGENRDYRLEIQNPQYNTFTRFNPYSWGNADYTNQNLWWPRVSAAAMITWEPIERLFIGLFVAPEILRLDGWVTDAMGISNAVTDPINNHPLGSDDINQDYADVKDVYKKMQVGVGYNIPGIGNARVQWVGIRHTFEFAFQVLALGDLMMDIGFKIPYEGTEQDVTNAYLTGHYKRKRDIQASVAATYRYYDFRMLGRIDTAFAGSDSSGNVIKMRGLNLIAYLVPSYNLSVGTVGLDIGFEYEQSDDFNLWENDSMQAGAAVWFSRSLGNANFKVAAVTRLPLEWAGQKQRFDVLFPIRLEVGF